MISDFNFINFINENLLSLIVFLPLIGAALIIIIPSKLRRLIEAVGVISAASPLLLFIPLLNNFYIDYEGFQFIERRAWLSDLFGIDYLLGIDGISLPLVLLTIILTVVSLVFSFNITQRQKEYFILFLLLQTALNGVFLSLNLVLFFIFWEFVLIPMYFIIGIWGSENRRYAAIKFILYTASGSLFILLAIIILFLCVGGETFNLPDLLKKGDQIPGIYKLLVFLFFFIGFAVKVPIVPLHTWLPDAHVEAPTAGSVLLAGVLLKLGAYGIIRMNIGIFPELSEELSIYLAILAVINIIYGAYLALAQSDIKKLIAYSSISHMGYVLLGTAALNNVGLSGALLQMFNHGTITGSLFLLVGVIYDRAHTKDISIFGGLAQIMPKYCVIMSLSCLASLGLPFLSGFVSELLCFIGGFYKYKIITIISVTGIVITAGYLLMLLHKIFFEELNPRWQHLHDLEARELFALVVLQIFIIFLGIYPKPFLDILITPIRICLVS